MKNQIVAFILLVSLSGCATIFTGSRQVVKVNSYPSGAGVFVEGDSLGVTPFAGKIKKGFTAKRIVLKKAGYQDLELEPNTTFNPTTILNLLFGGIVGFGIDVATGAMMHYSPTFYEKTLITK